MSRAEHRLRALPVVDATAAGPYRGKRAFDLAVLAVVAVPAAVVGAACAAMIKLTSRGPVLFRQWRVGLGAQSFQLLKFRTMDPDAVPAPAGDESARLGSIGRWLRRLSLDEIPQLANVARGDMSIVGPRPTLEYQIERYDARQRRRLCVRPGLTGLAQVRGRNAIGWAARIEHDLEYVERQSPWLDAAIILRTIPTLLFGRGAEGDLSADPIAVPADDR